MKTFFCSGRGGWSVDPHISTVHQKDGDVHDQRITVSRKHNGPVRLRCRRDTFRYSHRDVLKMYYMVVTCTASASQY